MRSAKRDRDAAWHYLLELDPDIALLQEVVSLPAAVSDHYAVVMRRACGKSGKPQRFSTVLLVRGTIGQELPLSSTYAWVDAELRRFTGNFVAAEVMLASGESFRVVSVYVPAWPIDRARLQGIDLAPVKLEHNPDIWGTELLWAALDAAERAGVPWVVAGDFNSSITFDLRGRGPRGNQEIQDRMSALGFVECLRCAQGQLTPTFKNPKGGKVVHQIDHLFLPRELMARLATCCVGDPERVFGESLSDHLPIIAELTPTAPPPQTTAPRA